MSTIPLAQTHKESQTSHCHCSSRPLILCYEDTFCELVCEGCSQVVAVTSELLVIVLAHSDALLDILFYSTQSRKTVPFIVQFL